MQNVNLTIVYVRWIANKTRTLIALLV